ncbi:hypothetical protein JAAARDRAFT_184041 [Jaapia argillacea MUCL 33604]|uniref:PIPK domain-containing protein n=1 Tax=Jaapia argillacea MUCL 33604 TaxID=933084 RepID=A0A067PMF9_9AGAM|nr:hypothetical protein JAAARDRAFT_184041 [Jaapia argillacea MUCL 33604]
MSADLQKPLPSIPHSGKNLATLTIVSREHLRRFIDHAIKEDPQIPSREDGGKEKSPWTSAIEFALAELGECMGNGGWLAGIKRARKRRDDRDIGNTDGKVLKENGREHGKEQKDTDKGQTEKEKGQATSSAKSVPNGGTHISPHRLEKSLPLEPEGPEPRLSQEDRPLRALQQLRRLVSKAAPLTPKPSRRHLLLTLTPFGSHRALPSEDMGFSLIPSRVGCHFTTGVYSLPDVKPGDKIGNGQVLYGLDEWDVDAHDPSDESLYVVGGTFTFKGVTSPNQHTALCNVLRLALYVYLSLVLEQHYLADSHVNLQFPKPTPSPQIPSVPLPPPMGHRPHSHSPRHVKRDSVTAAGIWSFVSKKTEDLLHRATSASVGSGRTRRVSLELPKTYSDIDEHRPRQSVDGPVDRVRKFSFFSGPSTLPPIQQDRFDESAESVFTYALKRIEEDADPQSTSPGVKFAPPRPLVALAEREKQDSSYRPVGDERAALWSISGWEGRETRGRRMAGTLGFIHKQELSTLYSEHVPTRPPSESSAKSAGSAISKASTDTLRQLTPCKEARWMTYVFNRWDNNLDSLFGDTLVDMCLTANKSCDRRNCSVRRGDHERRWIHNGIRIAANVIPIDDKAMVGHEEEISVWESCKECGCETQKSRLSDGSYLLSFAKFLEILVYSPLACTITPPICEHTSVPPRTSHDVPLPRCRLDIVRHFSFKSHQISFTLSAVEDIFEIRVPRLQILRSHGTPKQSVHSSLEHFDDDEPHEEKRTLRREIRDWWLSVAEHMDKLEDACATSSARSIHKSLPRIPSVDDPYDSSSDSDDGAPTPTAEHPGSIPFPVSAPNTVSRNGSFLSPPSSYFAPQRPGLLRSITSMSSLPQKKHDDVDPVELLSNLRETFHRTEQSLYRQLSQTPLASLNDVRQAFYSAARGAAKRLNAWQQKHIPCPLKDKPVVCPLDAKEPEWWRAGCHAVPGGRVVIREDDWGSIIAFTLSSTDYERELDGLTTTRTPSNISSSPLPTPMSESPAAPSTFSTLGGYKFFRSSSNITLDPDQDGIVWHEPEICSAVISRKAHPKDPTSILSLHTVLRQKADGSSSRLTGLMVGNSSSRPGSGHSERPGAPPSARAKPAVEVSIQAVGGELSEMPESVGAAGKILQEIGAVGPPSDPSTSASGSYVSTAGSSFVETHIRRGGASSVLTLDSIESGSTLTLDGSTAGDQTPRPSHLFPPSLPPKESHSSLIHGPPLPPKADIDKPLPDAGLSGSLTSTLTSSIANAMRYVLNSDTLRPSSPSPQHHGLLANSVNPPSSFPPIDDRPHIKYDWTIGKRLKFSCTVYYAKQFDALRKKCGVSDAFLKSMEKSTNWSAEGGKSRSNFWKTADDRFIIKTLVNAWNVADLQVLIDLGPSYFRYMDATTSKPTVLAKLLGFYTVEVRNLETGSTQTKADLLVMENLFYEKQIEKTFDLKGIHGRKVKPAGDGTVAKTLFDGEWIEGQQRALILVQPYSKVVLQEAIKHDSEFLSKSNIMDYSLLLGIDSQRKEIACGLVDTIGSYTFAKTLEYKAKQGLKPSGKEVTVIPPEEYKDRFSSAMDGYFLPCPDKWSKPMDDNRVDVPKDAWDLRCPM